jgi:O-antigen/teichoic acid export membrane protein
MNEDEIIKGGSKELIKHAANYAPALLLPALVNMSLIVIFTRIFSPAEFGIYNLATSSSIILTVILSFWIQQSALRYFPEYLKKGTLIEYKRETFLLLVVITVFFLAISIAFYPIFSNLFGDYGKFYFPTLFLTISSINYKGLTTIYLALQESKKYLIYQTLQAILLLVLSISFIYLVSEEVILVIIATGISQFLVILFIIHDLNLFKVKGITLKPNFSFLRDFAYYGFPMIGWFLSAQIMNLSDRFIIGIYRGVNEVGIYDSNYRIVAFGIGLLATPLINSAHPIIMNTYESGNQKITSKIILQFSRYYLILILPLIVFITILSREIVSLILGPAFREGYIVMPLILIGYSAWQFSFYGQKVFELQKATKTVFSVALLCAILNIIFNIILVYYIGYLGAAIASIISYSLYLILILKLSKKMPMTWEIPWKSILKISVSSIFAGIILFPIILIPINNLFLIFILISISLAIYFFTLYLFNEFNDNEIKLLKDNIKYLNYSIKNKKTVKL